MKRKKHQKQFLLYTFFLLLLGIGIGYAIIQSDLNLNGLTDIGTNTWDIHFANVQVTTGSVTASTPATINPSDNTKVNYSITLDKPGDFYEFTVDIVNAGTLPGEISLSTISGIDSTYEDIIIYTIEYSSGNPVQVGDILNDGDTKTVKVRTYFNQEIDPEDLPEDDFNLNLVLNVTYVQGDARERMAGSILKILKSEGNSCITKYNGQVTDQVGQTVTASNVYFNKCAEQRNVIFANICWQIIRTTETGGLKMVYNGEPVDGKCESTRSNHLGFTTFMNDSSDLISEYVYGTLFTIDKENNQFVLLNTETATYSPSTYENLLGKFTCKNTTGTCTSLYHLSSYSNDNAAKLTAYNIANTNYAEIGKSRFSQDNTSISAVGYMFDKEYDYLTIKPGTAEYKYGNSFTYNTNTNTYTLSGTTQNISDWINEGQTGIENTHYTCWNADGNCESIYYIFNTGFYNTNNFNTTAYYIELNGGKSINDALTEMLWSNTVNKYNSSAKGVVDSWFNQNLNNYTNYLEDTVYCASRTITDYAGLNPNGGNNETSVKFKSYNSTTDLSCLNETDQFAVSNNKAKLTFPVGLLTSEELFNLGEDTEAANNLRKTGASYWTMSPLSYSFAGSNSRIKGTTSDGKMNTSYTTSINAGIRPTITLKKNMKIINGTGSESNPWIIE